MRFATYNIEWMNGLFENLELQLDDKNSSRENTNRKEQAIAIAKVLKRLDPDAILILEAPNDHPHGGTVKALENFARHFDLRQSQAIMGFASGTDQEIALLYDPKIVSARFEAYQHKDAARFDKSFRIDLPGANGKSYQFSKPPLEAQIVHLQSEFAFRLIGCHLKSKAPHGASNDDDAARIALDNRRKQVAQASWIRNRTAHMHFPFIVAGDFNDGPGFDDYEQILGKSAVDILTEDGRLYDPSLFKQQRVTTSRFLNHEDQSYKEALLDFILVSKEMRPYAKSWRIWHPLHDPELQNDPATREAFLRASDHFPVTLDLVFDDART